MGVVSVVLLAAGVILFLVAGALCWAPLYGWDDRVGDRGLVVYFLSVLVFTAGLFFGALHLGGP